MKKNDEYINQSIEELENCIWGEAELDTYVIQTTLVARKKAISQLTHEEIRVLISQKVGLKYVLPIAVAILNNNPLEEVRHYEGDLLSVCLKLSFEDWSDNQSELIDFCRILHNNKAAIEACEEVSSEHLMQYLAIK